MRDEKNVVTSVRISEKLLADAKKMKINLSSIVSDALSAEIKKRKAETFYELRKKCAKIKIKTEDIVRIIRQTREES